MKKYLLGILVLVMMWKLVGFEVNAASLGQTTVRLDRVKTGESPLPILIMVETSTATVEDGLRLRVGNGWQVDSEAGNILVSTANLPAGVMAWPGIGGAIAVSGQMISLSSNDLTLGINYGFWITGGIGVNPSAGDGAAYKWLIETMSGGSPVDQREVKVPIIASDQILLTGRVPALASDFQLEMTADKTGNLAVDDEITYEISYGSYLPTVVKPLVITASWSRGTIAGLPTPNVDIADYVIGSGTTAWGGVSPVVDLINRRIVWTINTFPINTVNQTVQFKLNVNDSYTGSSNVTFEVNGYLDAANVVTKSQTITNTYVPPVVPTAIPTPTAVVTASPTPTPVPGTTTTTTTTTSVVPTVVPTSIATLKINKIEIVSMSDTRAGIAVETNIVPNSVKIRWGTATLNMTNSVTSVNRLRRDVIGLDGLKSGTDYYFRVEVVGENGRIAYSDLFTFRTALIGETPIIDKKSLLVTVQNNVILDASTETDSDILVIITPNEGYACRLNLSKPEIIKAVKIMIRDTRVLGINTVLGAEPNSAVIDLSEIVNGGFGGHLVSPRKIGYYDIVARIEDTNGNINEEKIGEMRVMEPLMVVDSADKPVENAKVTIYRYIVAKKIYELMPQNFLGIKNPSFTEPNGNLAIVLPKGKYRIEVSSIGYQAKKVDFDLGIGENEKLPKVVLVKRGISIREFFEYYGGIILDASGFSRNYLANLTMSVRFFRLMAWLVLLTGVGVVWEYLSRMYKVSFWLLPAKLVDNSGLFKKKIEADKLVGLVIDETTGVGIGNATVYLLDKRQNKVLSKGLTDYLGRFELKILPARGYRMAVTKDGYESTPMMDYTVEGIKANNIEIKIENVISTQEKIEGEVGRFGGSIGSVVISAGLLIMLILELMFWRTLGWVNVWPWVVISWLNMGLWLTMTLRNENK